LICLVCAMAAPESHKLDTTRAERNFLNMKDLLELCERSPYVGKDDTHKLTSSQALQ